MSFACPAPSFPIETIAHGRALIGVCGCPGGGPTPRADDLEAMAAFKPDAIVTLSSSQELRLVNGADLPDIFPDLARQWHHLVLQPGAAPDARFERLWVYAGRRLRDILRRGGRILVHCDGDGLRARWLASRLLSELGVPPDEAAARTRAPRLASMRPTGASLPRAPVGPDGERAGRILGCLLGGALGDAFGYPIEFLSQDQIRERFGEHGLSEPVARDGRLRVSDDTQMTLFTADGLLAAQAAGELGQTGPTLGRIRRAYLAWFRTQREEWSPVATDLRRFRDIWAVRAPGSTCLSALKAGGKGTPARPINDSKGSGAIMRVAPIGLLPTLDADDAFHLAHAAAALTHGHPAARLSAAAFASLLRDLLADTPLTAALARLENRLRTTQDADGVLAAIHAARALAASDTPTDEAVSRLGQGWSGDEALAIGLYAALRADSFAEALRLAANHDGDSDTTASLAGQIWGALYGVDVLVDAWVWRLDLLEAICEVAGRLIANAASEDAEDAPVAAPHMTSLRYRPAARV